MHLWVVFHIPYRYVLQIYIFVSRLSLIYIFNEKYKQYYIDYNMSPIVLYQTNCAVELLWELHFYTKLF